VSDEGPAGQGAPAGDAWAGAILIAMAIGIWYESTRWPAAVGFAGDPLVLPRSLALLMAGVAAALIFGALRRRAVAAAAGVASAGGASIRPVLLGIGATAGLGVLLEPLGLILAAFAYLFAMQRITAAPIRRAVIASIVIPALLWLAFVKVLNVPLPIGRIWAFLQ
jgi:hypothetical protein